MGEILYLCYFKDRCKNFWIKLEDDDLFNGKTIFVDDPRQATKLPHWKIQILRDENPEIKINEYPL